VWALFLVGFAACQEPGGGHPDGGEAGIDAADAGVDAGDAGDARMDARTDAAPLPDATQHDFCGEAFFKLPIDGHTRSTYGFSIAASRVAWASAPGVSVSADVSFIEFSTCLERQITQGGTGGNPNVSDDQSILYRVKPEDTASFCFDLVRYDVVAGTFEPLTATPACETYPEQEGHYLAYRSMPDLYSGAALRLRDLWLDLDVEIFPSDACVAGFDLGAKYLAWTSYTQEATSVGQDVFYYDLATAEITHVGATYEEHQEGLQAWDDWITWKARETEEGPPPNRLLLFHIPTGQATALAEDDWAATYGPIRDGLVAWNTARYTGEAHADPSDLEMLDLETWVERRITTEATPYRVVGLAPPFMLLREAVPGGDRFQHNYYVANLVALGIIDAQGRLIPGDGVIEPPPP
jgi:hypothetical protein